MGSRPESSDAAAGGAACAAMQAHSTSAHTKGIVNRFDVRDM
jgi:hypothetical protein